MTKEEAIEEIKRWTPILLNSGQCTEKTSEAQDMAISALSKEDNTMEWLMYGYATNEQIKNCTERYCCSKCHNIISRDYRYFKYCPNCGRKAVSE